MEIEVIYLSYNTYVRREWVRVHPSNGHKFYDQKLKQMKDTECLITLRDEKGNLVKCDKLNEKAVLLKKKK
jgi:hypothetical protein